MKSGLHLRLDLRFKPQAQRLRKSRRALSRSNDLLYAANWRTTSASSKRSDKSGSIGPSIAKPSTGKLLVVARAHR